MFRTWANDMDYDINEKKNFIYLPTIMSIALK